MAGYNSSNPFYTDEDEKGSFGKHHYNTGTSGHSGSENPFESEEDNRKNQVLSQIHASEDRQLESTRRIIMSIDESERVGVATAEELLRQGEQLDNIERKTTDMNQQMTTTQKHLNNIKSVFGGVKNWWTGRKSQQSSQETEPEPRPSKLRDAVDNSKNEYQDRRNVNTSGFGSTEEDDLDTKFMAGSRKQMIQPVTNSHREKEIDENLGLMSDGLSKLKGLALGLGGEIERQNEQIETKINPQMDKLNYNLDNQNTQMKKILRK